MLQWGRDRAVPEIHPASTVDARAVPLQMGPWTARSRK